MPVGPHGLGPHSTYKTVDGEYLLLGTLLTSVDRRFTISFLGYHEPPPEIARPLEGAASSYDLILQPIQKQRQFLPYIGYQTQGTHRNQQNKRRTNGEAYFTQGHNKPRLGIGYDPNEEDDDDWTLNDILARLMQKYPWVFYSVVASMAILGMLVVWMCGKQVRRKS